MKNMLVVLGVLVLCLGCAQVQVKAPKDPIKVDISMRVDVYQHVEKDINRIEDLVTGSGPAGQPTSFMDALMPSAHAQDDLPADVEAAALARKQRYDKVMSLLASGVIGENKNGLLEAVSGGADAGLVNNENNDRMAIYKYISSKNGASLMDVQKMYAARLQNDAPGGAQVQVLDPETNTYKWKRK
jgi:uncharacterized protein YdbL (DUF1318 family)